MSEWMGQACRLLEPGATGIVALACAVLAVLVLSAIAVGFVGLASDRRLTSGLTDSAPRHDLASIDDAGLLQTWRFYRHLGRASAADE